MSGWRRRRKKRLAPTPSTGSTSPQPIPADAPDSAPRQLELGEASHSEGQPAPPDSQADLRDEPPGIEPTAIFQLPPESNEAMPELELPAPEPALSEAAPEPGKAEPEVTDVGSGLTEPTVESAAQAPSPADEPTVQETELAPELTLHEPEAPERSLLEPVPEPEPTPREPEPPPEPTPGPPAPASAVARAHAVAQPTSSRRATSPPAGVERRADRVVHSPLAGPRRPSARDVQLDLEMAEREAASEALSAAGEEEEAAASTVLLEPVIPVTGLAQAGLSPAEIAAATRVAIEQLPGRSPRVETCPFLRSIALGALQAPRDTVDGRNRCAAFGEPLPLSRMQQGLVCLQPAHETCPRYVRGAMLIQQRIAPAPPPVGQRPVLIAAALLLLAVIAAAAYVLLGGRLEPQPTANPGAASPTLVAVSASPTPAPEPSASPGPTATAAPTARPTARPTPLPAQYRNLQHCPAPQKCFIYVVRRGDTLEAIARRFNTTVAVLRRMNPEIRGDYLRVGQKVKVPPP